MTYYEASPSYLKGIRGEVSQFAASVGRGFVSRRNVGVSANLRREQAPALQLKMLVYCHWSQFAPIIKTGSTLFSGNVLPSGERRIWSE